MDKIAFTPVEEDLRNAYMLHFKQAGWKKIGYLVLFGLAVGFILAAFDGFDNIEQSLGIISGMGLWAAVVALAIRYLIPLLWFPRMARKIYRQQKDLRLETEIWWDDDKFYSRSEQGEAHLSFSDMVKWCGNEDMILLYRSDHLYNFMPARVFADTSLRDGLLRRLRDSGVSGEMTI